MSAKDLNIEFAICVPRSASGNFDYSLLHTDGYKKDTYWGGSEINFSTHLKRELTKKYIVFVVELSDTMNLPGFPRVAYDKIDSFCKSRAKRIIVARITSNLEKYDTPFWPDESSSDIKYPYRFTFQVVLEISDVGSLDAHINKPTCNAIRKSASNGSMQSVESVDYSHGGNTTMINKPMTYSEQLQSFVNQFQQNLKDSGYVVADDLLIQRFVAALISKKFLILSGLSGSGKTKLAQLFAYWLVGSDSEAQCVIPVGADWVSNEQLMGYPDGLQPTVYVGKPVVRVILHARANPRQPHVIILDEMNLSHVERYFSDFLSAMESNEAIPLYEGHNRTFGGEVVPSRLKLPPNVFIIGTINVDETTYMFSPKVLDRANVIEFRMNRAMVDAYFDDQLFINHSRLDAKGTRFGADFVNWSQDVLVYFEMSDVWNNLYKYHMKLIFDEMSKARAEFGYRVMSESRKFMIIMYHLDVARDDASFVRAFDCMVVQKLMPKLNGSGVTLKALLSYLSVLQVNNMPLPQTNAKALRMLEKLKQDMYVSFAEA